MIQLKILRVINKAARVIYVGSAAYRFFSLTIQIAKTSLERTPLQRITPSLADTSLEASRREQLA